MNFQTLMQAGPAKAIELFAKLAETSDGAVKTREKLFGELKAELELHTNLEEQHLFPILRRHAETKEIVPDAIKENKELRAKLAELDGLPKNDEAFPERLKELQKTFRQHARDEKRELLPAVQRALSEEQVERVAGKIEASVAEAEQARQDELEERRTKSRQERERAEHQAEQQEAAQRAQKAAAAQVRHDEAEQKRAMARQEQDRSDRQAEQEAAAKDAKIETERRLRGTVETVARTAMTAQNGALRMAETATNGAQRVSGEIRGAADAYVDAVRKTTPDLRSVAILPKIAFDGMTEIRSTWMEWMGQTTAAGTQMSQAVLRQAAEQQRRFAADAMQRWLDHNAHVMRITMNMAQESFRSLAHRSSGNDLESNR